jgi:hypothetical protein
MTAKENLEQLEKARPSSFGTCRFCKHWNKPMYRYSVRHYICEDCRTRKMEELKGEIPYWELEEK